MKRAVSYEDDVAASVSACVIDQGKSGTISAATRAGDSKLACWMGSGGAGGNIKGPTIESVGRAALGRMLDGMKVPETFNMARIEMRKSSSGTGAYEDVSLFLVAVENGVLEAEWLGEWVVIRIREGCVETLSGFCTCRSLRGRLSTFVPSFMKKAVRKGDRFVMASPCLEPCLSIMSSIAGALRPSATASECCANLVHEALLAGIDNAAIVVVDVRDGILKVGHVVEASRGDTIMPNGIPAARRNREPHAKAFAFVLNQFLAMSKEAYAKDKSPSVITYWQCFFPKIDGRAWTRSNYEKEKMPSELFDELQPNVDALMGSGDNRAIHQFMDGSLFGKCCLVGWLVRTELGPFYALISSTLFDKYFGSEALRAYCQLLAEDFRSPSYLFHEFENCLDHVADLALGSEFAYSEPWPKFPAVYAQYLVSKAQSPKGLDYRADLATLLILAALNGPMDYRHELLVFSGKHLAKTRESDVQPKYRWDIHRDKVDVGECKAHLLRVAFPTKPANAREWMPCESSVASDDAPNGGTGIISYPLHGLDEVLLVRAEDKGGAVSRFTREGRKCTIPLSCWDVSLEHAKLTRRGDGWHLTDLDSSNGTLLVRVDDDRIHLCREGLAEICDNDVRLENGDVICLAPDWTNEQPLGSSPAFVFQLSVSKW